LALANRRVGEQRHEQGRERRQGTGSQRMQRQRHAERRSCDHGQGQERVESCREQHLSRQAPHGGRAARRDTQPIDRGEEQA
jgi:hypothetical protein